MSTRRENLTNAAAECEFIARVAEMINIKYYVAILYGHRISRSEIQMEFMMV